MWRGWGITAYIQLIPRALLHFVVEAYFNDFSEVYYPQRFDVLWDCNPCVVNGIYYRIWGRIDRMIFCCLRIIISVFIVYY